MVYHWMAWALSSVLIIESTLVTGAQNNTVVGRELMDVLKQETFQRVSDESSVFVYSAYKDSSMSVVRMIGITSQITGRLFCEIRYNDSVLDTVTSVTSPVRIAVINKTYKHRYVSSFFICPVPDVLETISLSLVTAQTSHSPQNEFLLLPQPLAKKHFITACLSPLHDNFDNVRILVEWFELNRILGIDYFTIYVTSASPEVRKVLRFYSQEGVANVISWPITDVVKISQVDYYGQQAALNDCLYRNRHGTQFLTAIDLDEFIIPQLETDRSLEDMLNRFPEASYYMFRHVALFTKDGTDSSGDKLITTTRTLRTRHVNPRRVRSKVIVVAENTLALAVHDVWSLRSGIAYVAEPEVGLLHHYRYSPVSLEKTHGEDFKEPVHHPVALKYADELQKNIHKVQTTLLTLHSVSVAIV